MKKDIRNKRWFTVIIAVFLLGCNGPTPRPSVPLPSTPTQLQSNSTTFDANKSFQADNGKSSLLFEDETIVRPEVDEGEINVHELTPQELSERVQDTPPPDGRKIITSLEILPSDMTFAPPAIVKFDVSDRDDLKRGDVLELYTFDEEKREWELLGKADVDNDWFAVARILHTSIYAVMDKVGSFSITDTSVHPDAPLTLTPSRTPTKTLTPSQTPTKTITPTSTPVLNSSILVLIYWDRDNNGQKGPSDFLLSATLELYDNPSCSGSKMNVTPSAVFGYKFSNLEAGSYCIKVINNSVEDPCGADVISPRNNINTKSYSISANQDFEDLNSGFPYVCVIG